MPPGTCPFGGHGPVWSRRNRAARPAVGEGRQGDTMLKVILRFIVKILEWLERKI
jgi:hypothetical protein